MRKRRAVKRDVLADPVYNSKVITKLINQIHTDMIGTNTIVNTESSIIDIIDVRVSIYRDSLIKYITEYKSMQTQLIERGS